MADRANIQLSYLVGISSYKPCRSGQLHSSVELTRTAVPKAEFDPRPVIQAGEGGVLTGIIRHRGPVNSTWAIW
jgi:hypothetical protein